MDAIHLNVSLGSYHFDRQAVEQFNFNEKNRGIGLEHDSGDHRQFIGYYNNSEGKQSYYLLASYLPLEYRGVRVGIIGGAVTGYSVPVAPAIGLLAAYSIGKWGLNVTMMPTVKTEGFTAYGFTGLQLRYKLK